MTREEAIKLIDTHTVCFYNEIDSPTLQALHLAIEALSANATVAKIQIDDIDKAKTSNKHILDATCGSRMIWFDKYCEEAIFMDKRVVENEIIWTSKDGNDVRRLNIQPDVVADFTDMPFADDSFNLVVFDPPHLTRLGETSWLGKKYGRLEGAWQNSIHDGFAECMRVCKPYGTVIFKWNETDIKVSEICSIIGQQPLFGSRGGKAFKTHWMVFMKIPQEG